MIRAATAMELFQGNSPARVVLGQVRFVQLAESLVEAWKPESFLESLGEGVVTAVRDRKTLLEESPQTAPTKTAKPAVNGHDPRRLITDCFDFRIDELKRTTASLPHLAVEIELLFVSESGVDPSVIEPDDLEISATVVNETIDDHFASRQSAHSNARYAPFEQDPRAHLDGLIQTGDPGPILVPKGQVKQKIEDCMETLGRQRLRAFRTDAFEFCQWVAG